MQALHESAVPASLRALMIDAAQDAETPSEAVDAMRQALNSLSIEGTVVIGEGERDALKEYRATLLESGATTGSYVVPTAFTVDMIEAIEEAQRAAPQATMSCQSRRFLR